MVSFGSGNGEGLSNPGFGGRFGASATGTGESIAQEPNGGVVAAKGE